MSKKGFPHTRNRGHLIIKTAKQGKKTIFSKDCIQSFQYLKDNSRTEVASNKPIRRGIYVRFWWGKILLPWTQIQVSCYSSSQGQKSSNKRYGRLVLTNDLWLVMDKCHSLLMLKILRYNLHLKPWNISFPWVPKRGLILNTSILNCVIGGLLSNLSGVQRAWDLLLQLSWILSL